MNILVAAIKEKIVDFDYASTCYEQARIGFCRLGAFSMSRTLAMFSLLVLS